MLRKVASKVAWVGRTTSMVFGLALILALMVGLVSTAFAANGENFIIGNGLADTVRNIATAPTKLAMQGDKAGPALQVNQQSTNTGASGIGVSVPAGKAPLKVNSTAGKATNLSADELDGQDSSAFGFQVRSNTVRTDSCDAFVEEAGHVWAECAPITVKVPAGRTYFVSEWSNIVAAGGETNEILGY